MNAQEAHELTKINRVKRDEQYEKRTYEIIKQDIKSKVEDGISQIHRSICFTPNSVLERLKEEGYRVTVSPYIGDIFISW